MEDITGNYHSARVNRRNRAAPNGTKNPAQPGIPVTRLTLSLACINAGTIVTREIPGIRRRKAVRLGHCVCCSNRTCKKPCNQEQGDPCDRSYQSALHRDIISPVFQIQGRLMVVMSENFFSVIPGGGEICRGSGSPGGWKPPANLVHRSILIAAEQPSRFGAASLARISDRFSISLPGSPRIPVSCR